MSVGFTIQELDIFQFIKRCKVFFVLFLIFMNNICYFRNLEGVPTKLRMRNIFPGEPK